MSVRIFLDKINIGICRLNKEDPAPPPPPAPPVRVGIIQYVEGLTRTKRWEKGELTLSAWLLSWNISFLPLTGTYTSGPLRLRIIPPAFLRLQLCVCTCRYLLYKFLLLNLFPWRILTSTISIIESLTKQCSAFLFQLSYCKQVSFSWYI